ncbi:aldehyde dehydrogenase family protein [Paraburkholderia silvatlantica]|uniref:aldehyde dehydrogenase family protein n=1 Tax=Paraburkholderia silvatlantica TaxID=321895 RepID=UPI003752C0D7
MIRTGIEEGAQLVTGGPGRHDGLTEGFFVRPTIFANVGNDARIAREETFGPVLTIIPYDSEDEAIALPNDTGYGPAARVWSGDPPRPARRSAATSIPATGANWACTVSPNISSTSPSRSEAQPPAARGRLPLP